MKKKSIVIVDGNREVCKELADILNRSESFEVLATVHDGVQADALLQDLTPDMLILGKEHFGGATCNKTEAQPSAANQQTDGVAQILHKMKIPAHLKGHQYLKEALLLATQDTTFSSKQTTVYSRVAEKFLTTSCRVERAVQHAIEVAWHGSDSTILQELFGDEMPTNGEFILRLAEEIAHQKP